VRGDRFFYNFGAGIDGGSMVVRWPGEKAIALGVHSPHVGGQSIISSKD
jgi:hypothetical protein